MLVKRHTGRRGGRRFAVLAATGPMTGRNVLRSFRVADANRRRTVGTCMTFDHDVITAGGLGFLTAKAHTNEQNRGASEQTPLPRAEQIVPVIVHVE